MAFFCVVVALGAINGIVLTDVAVEKLTTSPTFNPSTKVTTVDDVSVKLVPRTCLEPLINTHKLLVAGL